MRRGYFDPTGSVLPDGGGEASDTVTGIIMILSFQPNKQTEETNKQTNRKNPNKQGGGGGVGS